MKRIIRLGILFLISSVLSFGAYSLWAQGVMGEAIPAITFADSVHNFGLVAEEKGPVGCIFSFTNTGNAPLVITNATADCGCTTPSYTRETVEPGAKGEVRVSYNPEGRPGTFVKKVRIYSNAGELPKELVIKGNVTTLGGNEDRKYQLRVGGLQVSNQHLAFPIVSAEGEAAIRLVVNNPTDQPIMVRLRKVPKFVSISKTEFTLAPNEPEELYLTSLVSSKDKPALRQGVLRLEAWDTQGGVRERTDIKVSMPVVPDELMMATEKAPKMDLLTYFDFGERSATETIKGRISIENKGDAPLEIYSIVSDNKAIKIKAKSKIVAAGEKGELVYSVNMREVARQGGKLSQNVDILVNDPHGPLRKVRFEAAVRK
ncbi:DUF1573 domain-containing protein [Porphyromonas endodontalis]|uniref:DUF1573 domain-containing protein n=1 Tax=Porphyromonas endodontalis TaxID=28124 RepID=UPI0028ECA93B|nr:DUF1573 domain-containing protein [Porphyromonas endodontalis]